MRYVICFLINTSLAVTFLPDWYVVIPVLFFAVMVEAAVVSEMGISKMLTRQRIREILQEQGLTPNQIDDVAAYCDTVQTELTEQDVRDFAEIIVKKGVDHGSK